AVRGQPVAHLDVAPHVHRGQGAVPHRGFGEGFGQSRLSDLRTVHPHHHRAVPLTGTLRDDRHWAVSAHRHGFGDRTESSGNSGVVTQTARAHHHPSGPFRLR